MRKMKNLILLVISICVVLLAGCERKVSEEDALKEFEEAADELMENNVLTKDRTSEQIKGPIILTNAYSDFAAKVIAPDGFLYFNEEDSVFADALAASITESLTYYSDDSDNSLDYLFQEYNPLESAQEDAEERKQMKEYTQLSVTDIKEVRINGYDIKYIRMGYKFNGDSAHTEYTACVKVNDFQYFTARLELINQEEPEDDEKVMETIFHGVELYETGEEPRTTYYWNEELKPDEEGIYHIKDITNSTIKAAVGVPKGYEYDDSNAGNVSFHHYDEDTRESYQIMYQFIEQEGAYSIEEELNSSDILNDESGFYSDAKMSDVQTATISGYEVQYARLDYRTDSIHYTEYRARTKVQEDYLDISFSYSGDNYSQIDDTILEGMLDVVQIE